MRRSHFLALGLPSSPVPVPSHRREIQILLPGVALPPAPLTHAKKSFAFLVTVPNATAPIRKPTISVPVASLKSNGGHTSLPRGTQLEGQPEQ